MNGKCCHSCIDNDTYYQTLEKCRECSENGNEVGPAIKPVGECACYNQWDVVAQMETASVFARKFMYIYFT